MRDHLLGCAQFIPDVENERVMSPAKAKPFALGIPTRVHAEAAAKFTRWDAANATKEFEDTDHTPAGMMADFPREYDLKAMLNEAAGRRDAISGSWGKSLDDLMREYDDLMREYDEQVQRQCGINDLVLNANESTMMWRYPGSAEIKDFYKRAALNKVTDQERATFEARLKVPKMHVGVDLAKPSASDQMAAAFLRGYTGAPYDDAPHGLLAQYAANWRK